jgi:hypothetical protein
MDDSQLRSKVPHIPKTPLIEGVAETYERFVKLRKTAA